MKSHDKPSNRPKKFFHFVSRESEAHGRAWFTSAPTLVYVRMFPVAHPFLRALIYESCLYFCSLSLPAATSKRKREEGEACDQPIKAKCHVVPNRGPYEYNVPKK